MDIKLRIWAENGEFSEGKMYYPHTMHDEVNANRGFFMNQSGDILHGRHVNEREATWTLLWARIGYNNVTKMLGSGIKDTGGNEIYAGDIISYQRANRKVSKDWFSKVAAVYYDEGCFCVDGILLKDLQGDVYIKGNIFENPELIGLEKEEVSE